MQVQRQEIEKRCRYYHSQMDMELLLSGEDYSTIPNSYVIFICDFDPFDLGKYRYTVAKHLPEADNAPYDDGVYSIFLCTAGKNAEEVPEPLVKFLKFVHADLKKSEADFDDEYVRTLQEMVKKIKSSREMGARYMLYEEMLRNERAEGLAEGLAKGKTIGITEGIVDSILDFLNDLGPIDEAVRDRLVNIRDLAVLKKLNREAARASSVSQFESYMNSLNII
jgi:predicted transposase/invertase (TIGR01784 family)